MGSADDPDLELRPVAPPFNLVRFVVGVSTTASDRRIVERRIALNQVHRPLGIEILDQFWISELLPDKPQIVIKYFGPAAAAERFCVPQAILPVEVAEPEAVATAHAVHQGPLAMVGGQHLLERARELITEEPTAALAQYRGLQDRLVSAGFPGRAAEFDEIVAAFECQGW
jgi:hypothetical protein